ncbi:pilus assembly PilX N-terminal domain-containing protein [Deinococcus planocerae]|uniref:pilus assembly PilX N-terminal domain-containing protein n=1 Tax=Deinococcus planocerae TaxID=1737569 RepID=UPI0015E0C910|nr:pilus assembly PilX N-terminal domain-containing protein [Deinococcus planocerae]
MRGPSSTRGATLVVVVLFTTLLLAVLLAASSQLTLSSRRSVGDQRAALQAQYVAESGVALARSRLRDVQTLLSEGSIMVPSGTTASKLKGYAEKFCGNTTWVTTTEASGTQRSSCTAAPNAAAADQFEVFALFVKPTRYTELLPAGERPSNVGDLAATRAWWRDQLALGQQVSADGVTLNYRLRPSRVERVNNESYRFYVQLDALNVGGTQNNATRVLAASRTTQTGWWVEVALPSYLDNVLFTNHHTSDPNNASASSWKPTVNFTGQEFDGPVHTNERFLFANGATAKFRGKLSSAGCTNLKQSGLNDDKSCTQSPGYYYGGGDDGNLRRPATSATSDVDKNASLLNRLGADVPNVELANVKNADGTPSPVKDVTFTAPYRPMPVNANSQRSAAQGKVPDEKKDDPEEVARYTGGRGLYFSDDVAGIILAAGDANGNSPGNYNATTKTWSPAPTYQYIRVAKKSENQFVRREERCVQYYTNGSCYRKETFDVYRKVLSDFDEYRVNAAGRMEKRGGSGWSPHLDKFNGVIFGEKGIGALEGPERNGTLAPPAIAPFSQLTVAAENDISIAGDLTLSSQPCMPTDAPCKAAKPDSPDNVLGIYSQSGDVVIAKEAPNNLNIHAMLMSSKGEVRVDGYDFGAQRGDVNLIGGLVENWYGAFGTFGNTDTGYGRKFSHDRRFEDPGFTPPFFAQSPVWIPTDAGSALGLDNLVVNQGDKSDLKDLR